MGLEDGTLAANAARVAMCGRVDDLARSAGRMPLSHLLDEIDALRRQAERGGLAPVATIAHAIEGALARGERGPMLLAWLDTLREALDCERLDEAAGQAFAAHLQVRFAG